MIVLINVFTVDPANQQRLVDILTNGGPKLAITDRAPKKRVGSRPRASVGCVCAFHKASAE